MRERERVCVSAQAKDRVHKQKRECTTTRDYTSKRERETCARECNTIITNQGIKLLGTGKEVQTLMCRKFRWK